MTDIPLSWQFCQNLPYDTWDHVIQSGDPRWGQQCTFDEKAIECIADELQDFIASVIAYLIDAGSERDAINEDEQLAKVLRDTLKGW